jgi:hypothetical protein
MIPCYEKIARHCCAAGFQFGLCLLRVSSVDFVLFATLPLYPHELT